MAFGGSDISHIELNSAGVRALLKSPEVEQYLAQKGRAIRDAAGGIDAGYEMTIRIGKTRARVTIRTETFEARYAEATKHTLTRALGAGRG